MQPVLQPSRLRLAKLSRKASEAGGMLSVPLRDGLAAGWHEPCDKVRDMLALMVHVLTRLPAAAGCITSSGKSDRPLAKHPAGIG